jgi:hypothetical protein
MTKIAIRRDDTLTPFVSTAAMLAPKSLRGSIEMGALRLYSFCAAPSWPNGSIWPGRGLRPFFLIGFVVDILPYSSTSKKELL